MLIISILGFSMMENCELLKNLMIATLCLIIPEEAQIVAPC